MEKIKWGVLGTANIAKNCTIPGMQLANSCELYAVAGRSIEKATTFKNEFGFEKAYGSYEELLDDPKVQAIYIPLPNNLHYEWVINALNKKKHVLCEKPLALSEAEVVEMFDCAKANGVILMEAYAYLHSPYIKSLIDDVKGGVIGDVNYIDTKFITQFYKEDIRLYKDMGGGAMYDLGCYCTSLILSLFDSKISSVKAIAEFTDKGVDSLTTAIISFENGLKATIAAGMILGEDTDERLDRLFIRGDKGRIISNVEFNQEGQVSYQIEGISGLETKTINNPQNYSLEVENLSQSILGIETPCISMDFSLKNARLIDAVLKEIGYK